MARLKPPRRPPRSKRATSAGGIVIRHLSSGSELLLGKRRRPRDGASWSLPKGTPAGAETIEETALREVAEETGLQVRILAPVGSIEYFFTQGGVRVHKTVHYFLMEAVGGELAAHDHEFDEVSWVPLDRARDLLTFATERGIVEQALPLAGAA